VDTVNVIRLLYDERSAEELWPPSTTSKLSGEDDSDLTKGRACGYRVRMCVGRSYSRRTNSID
jgi:hypothetical protein